MLFRSACAKLRPGLTTTWRRSRKRGATAERKLRLGLGPAPAGARWWQLASIRAAASSGKGRGSAAEADLHLLRAEKRRRERIEAAVPAERGLGNGGSGSAGDISTAVGVRARRRVILRAGVRAPNLLCRAEQIAARTIFLRVREFAAPVGNRKVAAHAKSTVIFRACRFAAAVGVALTSLGQVSPSSSLLITTLQNLSNHGGRFILCVRVEDVS